MTKGGGAAIAAEVLTLVALGNDAAALMVCGEGWRSSAIDAASIRFSGLNLVGAKLSWEGFAEGLAYYDFQESWGNALH